MMEVKNLILALSAGYHQLTTGAGFITVKYKYRALLKKYRINSISFRLEVEDGLNILDTSWVVAHKMYEMTIWRP